MKVLRGNKRCNFEPNKKKRAPPPKTKYVCVYRMYVRVCTVNNAVETSFIITRGTGHKWRHPVIGKPLNTAFPLASFCSTFHLGRHTTDLTLNMVKYHEITMEILAEPYSSCVCQTKHLLTRSTIRTINQVSHKQMVWQKPSYNKTRRSL